MILLTGSNGYLGSVLYPKLHRDEYNQVECVDLGIFFKQWEYKTADLSRSPYSDIFTTIIYNAVVHLAGISNDPSSELSPALTERMNVEASKRLIDFAAANGAKRFIFASSASVYGANDSLVTESSPLNPQSHYAESKAKVEEYLMDFKELNPVILRFGTLFGLSTKMRFDIAVNLMSRDAALYKKIKVSGSGENFRPFLHVDDAASAIDMFRGSLIGSGIYNVAIGNIRIKSLAEIVASITGSSLEMESQDHADPRNYRMDCTKFNTRFPDFAPYRSIVGGIDSVYGWCIKHTDKLNNPDYYTLDCWKKFIESENS